MDPISKLGLAATVEQRADSTVRQATQNSTTAIQTRRVRDFSWTADNDPKISHYRLIGRGGGGQVHEVLCHTIVPDE
jgi:hypothetical protein